MAERTMVEALNLAMRQEMENDEDVVLLGEDIGIDGGIFRVTDGLLDAFGQQRVIDTPLAESAIVGCSLGMALAGLKPVCELQFSGFSYLAFHQFESHVARYRWRSQGRYGAQIVARMPYGGGVRALEHHSESREVYYAHTPGLKLVVPSTPRNARALLVSAIRDPDPVIFFEPKALYRSVREDVPDEEETLPIGRSRIARKGEDITFVAYGAMLARTMEAAEKLAEDDGIDAEIIDLMTIQPLDDSAFSESVRKTGRCVVVHEAPRSFGPAGEIAARLMERVFLYLEAPVQRVTGADVHIPLFAREQAYLPEVERIVAAARLTLDF
jgi:pyruvate dehydrogenase E1 component beta subunit